MRGKIGALYFGDGAGGSVVDGIIVVAVKSAVLMSQTVVIDVDEGDELDEDAVEDVDEDAVVEGLVVADDVVADVVVADVVVAGADEDGLIEDEDALATTGVAT